MPRRVTAREGVAIAAGMSVPPHAHLFVTLPENGAVVCSICREWYTAQLRAVAGDRLVTGCHV